MFHHLSHFWEEKVQSCHDAFFGLGCSVTCSPFIRIGTPAGKPSVVGYGCGYIQACACMHIYAHSSYWVCWLPGPLTERKIHSSRNDHGKRRARVWILTLPLSQSRGYCQNQPLFQFQILTLGSYVIMNRGVGNRDKERREKQNEIAVGFV